MPVDDQVILDYVAEHPGSRRGEIHRHVAKDVSAPTLWRVLKRLVEQGRLEVAGRARATGYALAGAEAVKSHIQTPHNRRIPTSYQKSFLDGYVPDTTFYLGDSDRVRLHKAGRPQSPPLPAGTYARRILERLLVDLSWASSRLEGNTYDILQTERLIRFGEEASDKNRKESVMILNHKEAIQYVVDHLEDIAITRVDLFNIHALLADGLLIDPALAGRLRRMPVGISESSYRPLEDAYAIEEEFRVLVAKAAAISDPFEQSFFLLVHIPYLQAFVDVNKRTSRIAANIPLLKAGLAPLSFTTMDNEAYIDALIGVYELNNVSLQRQVFMDAYLTSARNYVVLRAELDSPDKATLVYRDFVREAVRRNVLEFQGFDRNRTLSMAEVAGIPHADRGPVADYIEKEIRGLHEGNAIRYRLTTNELALIGIVADDAPRSG